MKNNQLLTKKYLQENLLKHLQYDGITSHIREKFVGKRGTIYPKAVWGDLILSDEFALQKVRKLNDTIIEKYNVDDRWLDDEIYAQYERRIFVPGITESIVYNAAKVIYGENASVPSNMQDKIQKWDISIYDKNTGRTLFIQVKSFDVDFNEKKIIDEMNIQRIELGRPCSYLSMKYGIDYGSVRSVAWVTPNKKHFEHTFEGYGRNEASIEMFKGIFKSMMQEMNDYWDKQNKPSAYDLHF